MAKKKQPKTVTRGNERANKVSAAERKETARKGVRQPALRETHSSSLVIGSAEIACGVREDGTRIFSRRGVGRAFGSRKTGVEVGAPEIPPFLASRAILPFISGDLMALLESPIAYLPKHGGRTGLGYEASILPAICEVILDADRSGALTSRTQRFANVADMLLRGFARLGVIALIDEATGYQYDRARNALAEILEKFIRKELAAWARVFPDEYYEHIYRLRGWTYEGTNKRTPLIGTYTKDVVYQRLAPGVLDELERINPRVDGYRRAKHHQWMTEDIGHPKLREHLTKVVVLMQAADDWSSFKRMLNRVLPKHDLPLFEWAAKKEREESK